MNAACFPRMESRRQTSSGAGQQGLCKEKAAAAALDESVELSAQVLLIFRLGPTRQQLPALAVDTSNSTQEPEHPLPQPRARLHLQAQHFIHMRSGLGLPNFLLLRLSCRSKMRTSCATSWRPVLGERTIVPFDLPTTRPRAPRPDSFGLPLGRAHVRGRARAPAARWTRRLSVG